MEELNFSVETAVEAPYSRHINATLLSPSQAVPLRDDLEIVRGDQVDLYYLWNNVVYTPERPLDDNDLPMYASSETVPEEVTASPTPLIAPWKQLYWHAEVRNTYLSSIRTFNGWVPWYGRRPDWSWWQGYSLVGIFEVEAVYDADKGGTVTHLILPSLSSSKIKPGGHYFWDLESAVPAEWNEEDPPEPIKYTGLKTRVSGRCVVHADWTLSTPIA